MNWIKTLPKLKYPLKDEVLNDEKITSFCKFINRTTHECNVVLFVCARYQTRPWVELFEIYEALHDIQSTSATYNAIEHLFTSGWLQVNCEQNAKDSVQISFTHNIEVALKTSDAYIFKIHKVSQQHDKAIIRIHVKALHVKAALCDTDTFKRFCQAYIAESNDPLARQLRRLKFNRLTLAAVLYIFSNYSIEGRFVELKPLAILLSSNRIEARRYFEQWCSLNWKPVLASVLIHETGPGGQLFVKPAQEFQKTVCQFNAIKKNTDVSLPSTIQRIEAKKIHEKSLFYNAKIKHQIQLLEHMITPEGFTAYSQNLAEHAEHACLSVLLSGGPGTGKTELARQLARMTNRDLWMFNVAQQRDKYFGESEKNIKQIFDLYQTQAQDPSQAPILFFNEADSVFQNRQSLSHNTSNTEQVIQTILLNALEQFKGIIICTTNRANSFDEAFNRRFLMHIIIDAPNFTTRKLIVQHMFPEFTNAQCQFLAEHHEFTAADLKNAKSLLLMHKLSGKSIASNFDTLYKLLQKPIQ